MLDIRMGLPEPVFELPDDERDERAEIGGDSGIYREPDGREHYYVRGLLEIPIPSLDGYFGYGTWIEVDGESYDRLGDLWHDEAGASSRRSPAGWPTSWRPTSERSGCP